MGRQPVDCAAVEHDRAGGRLEASGNAVEQGRFAGAVRADDALDHALLYGKTYVLDGMESAEGLAEVFDF
jgi:hypothetical protein